MKHFIRSLSLIILFFCGTNSYANYQPLTVDKAFALSAKIGVDNTVDLNWRIAPNYHLYRKQFAFKTLSPKTAELGHVLMPSGIHKSDNIMGKYQAYYKHVTIKVPVLNPKDNTIRLQVSYQGCADAGFCYPIVNRDVYVNFAKNVLSLQGDPTLSASGKVTELLEKQNLFYIILGFIGFGILLCFTPCVLPMLPILTSIIVGQKNVSSKRSFFLALSYVFGMSISYALAGVLAAHLGESIQASLQNPWVLGSFSAVFVLLSLSLFGFYELQLPSGLRNRINQISNQQKTGSLIGAFIMGALSTLVVSPCITPPLVGALAYIGQTHDMAIGAIALFSLGLGMGIPLILFATLGGKLLPKAGQWMVTIKAGFGVLLLAVAVWLLERIIPGPITMLLWAGLLIIPAVYLGCFDAASTASRRFFKGLGIIMLIYGILLMVGASMGGSDPMKPLQPLTQRAPGIAPVASHDFVIVKNLNQLDKQLALAKLAGKPVLLDFHADWCPSCKEMEHETFANPTIKKALAHFVLIRADVTKNNSGTHNLQKRYGIIAPPALIFYDKTGHLNKGETRVGFQAADKLQKQLARLR